MKIGTTIFLIVMLLISFGYVISDDLNLRKRMAQVLAENVGLRTLLSQENQNLNICQETARNNAQILTRQEREINSLKSANAQQADKIQSLEGEAKKCEAPGTPANQDPGGKIKTEPLIAIAIFVPLAALAILKNKTGAKLPSKMMLPGLTDKGETVRLTRKELEKVIALRRTGRQ